jgi:DNA polymerase kappa
MPGFYEYEDEASIGEHDDGSDPVHQQLLPDHPRCQPSTLKPVSESKVSDFAKSSRSLANNARLSAKPHSTSTGVRPKSPMSSSGPPRNSLSESLTCPVCEKVFQTDNEGLNSHIDFCLSRGAIRQAHAEASSPVKKSSKTGRWKDQIVGIQSTTKRMGNS